MWSAARPSVIGNGYLAGAGSTGPAGFAINASCRTEGPHRRKADPVFRIRRSALQEGSIGWIPKGISTFGSDAAVSRWPASGGPFLFRSGNPDSASALIACNLMRA
jgi:hypothetical protein